MKILQVPILYCFRCKVQFTPRIDPAKELVLIPKACPNRNCRSQTWNVANSELDSIRKSQNRNLLMGSSYRTGITKSVTVLDKYKPKKKEKISLIVCVECELFFHDEGSLTRHQHRRHHGMCSVCHSSNVFVVVNNGCTICKTCVTLKKK